MSKAEEGSAITDAGNGGGANFVVFRNPIAQQKVSPLKLEVEKEAPQGMSPKNMWQVYALTGFMVMRWLWARWTERKNDSSGEASGGRQAPN